MKKIYAIILIAFALITGFMVGGIVVMKMWQRQNIKIESLLRASNRFQN